MTVVADTSPLNYLIQIEHDYLLPKLFQHVFMPTSVVQEWSHPGAPSIVQQWLTRCPEWVVVRSPHGTPDARLQLLDLGERMAILVAEEQKADLILMDERKGRAEAKRRGIKSTGTLGVLISGAEAGWINPLIVYDRLISETNFRKPSA